MLTPIVDAEFDQAINSALAQIQEWIKALPERIAASSPPLAYLKHLEGNGLLRVRIEPAVTEGEPEWFEFSLRQRRLVYSDKFRAGWLKMANEGKVRPLWRTVLSASGPNEERRIDTRISMLELALRHFLVHEIFHDEQQLTSEQHDDIRGFPGILSIVDYHADAYAVCALTLLDAEFDPDFSYPKWRDLYGRWTRAALWHLYAFVTMGRVDERSTNGWPLDAFNRHFIWHYQHHRARRFLEDAHYEEFQILFQPLPALRAMQALQWKQRNRPPLSRKWPTVEAQARAQAERKAATVSRSRAVAKSKGKAEPLRYSLEPTYSTHDWPAVLLIAPNYWGVPSIKRYSAPLSESKSLFEGIFEGDTELTGEFFGRLFHTYRDLIGEGWSPPTRPDPDPPGLSGPHDLDLSDCPKLLRLAELEARESSWRRFLPVRALAVGPAQQGLAAQSVFLGMEAGGSLPL